MTDAFVERSRSVARTDAIFDLDPRHTAAAPVAAAHQEPGRSGSALFLAGARVADPRRRQRADRVVAALPPQQAEPQGQPASARRSRCTRTPRSIRTPTTTCSRWACCSTMPPPRTARWRCSPAVIAGRSTRTSTPRGASSAACATRTSRAGSPPGRCCWTCPPAASTSTTTGSFTGRRPTPRPASAACSSTPTPPPTRSTSPPTPTGSPLYGRLVRGTWPAVARRTAGDMPMPPDFSQGYNSIYEVQAEAAAAAAKM